MPRGRVAVPAEIVDDDPDLAQAIARRQLAKLGTVVSDLTQLDEIPLYGLPFVVYEAEIDPAPTTAA